MHPAFIRPEKPKNTWEILRWYFFEPLLLVRYYEKLSKKESINFYIKIHVLIFLIISFFYIFSVFTVILFDLHSKNFNFQNYDFINKLLLIFYDTFYYLILILVISIIGNILTFNLSDSLTFLMIVVSGFFLGIGSDLLFGLEYVIFSGIFFGFMVSNQLFNNILGVLIGIIISSLFILYNNEIYLGFIYFCIYIFFFFRIWALPKYIYWYFQEVTLFNNPYLRDGLIRINLSKVKNKIEIIIKKEKQQHSIDFIYFLMKNRPLQGNWAYRLLHLLVVIKWNNMSYLSINEFNVIFLPSNKNSFIDIPNILQIFHIMYIKKNINKEYFKNNYNDLQYQINNYEQETHLLSKIKILEKIIQLLKEFEINILQDFFEGKEYYPPALAHLKHLAEKELAELKSKYDKIFSITSSPFKVGKPLQPEYNKNVFLGRTYLKEIFTQKVLNSKELPTFLIHGQRRVGKTSLGNFLEMLLGIRFKVVQMDFQSAAYNQNILSWLKTMRKEIQSKCYIDKSEWVTPENVLEAWLQIEKWLEDICKREDFYLVLTFDEYQDFHQMLQEDVKIGEKILKAMRSFSQRQNKVVFLFVGSHTFDELFSPDWSSIFVHTETLYVDYLNKEDSITLLSLPNEPDFHLRYEEGLLEHIYSRTKGHPHLLQYIGNELVTRSNHQSLEKVGFQDLEIVLDSVILQDGTQPFSSFWMDYCQKDVEMQKTVIQICQGENPNHRESLLKLLKHQYIFKNQEEKYEMRVPLYQEWILRNKVKEI